MLLSRGGIQKDLEAPISPPSAFFLLFHCLLGYGEGGEAYLQDYGGDKEVNRDGKNRTKNRPMATRLVLVIFDNHCHISKSKDSRYFVACGFIVSISCPRLSLSDGRLVAFGPRGRERGRVERGIRCLPLPPPRLSGTNLGGGASPPPLPSEKLGDGGERKTRSRKEKFLPFFQKRKESKGKTWFNRCDKQAVPPPLFSPQGSRGELFFPFSVASRLEECLLRTELPSSARGAFCFLVFCCRRVLPQCAGVLHINMASTLDGREEW